MSIKIAIGLPNRGYIHEQTALSLMEMTELPYKFVPFFTRGCFISAQREFIAQIAIKAQFTYLLFIDSDIKFPPETIDKLIQHDKDIIGAMYHYRYLPKKPIVKFLKNERLVDEGEVPNKVFKVGALGMGCMLIKTSVFHKMKKPYFTVLFDNNGQVHSSEDINFCVKARKAGFDIWCDPVLEIKHIGDYEY